MSSIIESVLNRITSYEISRLKNPVIIPIKKTVQMEDYTCGLECVRCVLNFKNINVNDLKSKLGTNPDDGTDEDNIYALFDDVGIKYNINANASAASLIDALNHNKLILTTVFEEEHWVLVYGYHRDGFLVMDPSPKRAWFSSWSFEKMEEDWDKWSCEIC